MNGLSNCRKKTNMEDTKPLVYVPGLWLLLFQALSLGWSSIPEIFHHFTLALPSSKRDRKYHLSAQCVTEIADARLQTQTLKIDLFSGVRTINSISKLNLISINYMHHQCTFLEINPYLPIYQCTARYSALVEVSAQEACLQEKFQVLFYGYSILTCELFCRPFQLNFRIYLASVAEPLL